MALKENAIIEKYDVLGLVGCTGNSCVSPHLHFELRIGTICSLEY